MSLAGWKDKKPLTIKATDVDSDVTDFHYLVYLDNTNFNFGEAQSNGYDIRFTSSDGTTLLNYFREKHDATNQVAIYHVKIPTVSSSSDTTIYMYYGNSSASDGASAYADVFNNQVAYYPLDGNANDLSGNYNGTWHGTQQYDTGVLGQAAKFDGSSDIATSVDMNSSTFSFSAWIKAITLNTDSKFIFDSNGTSRIVFSNGNSNLPISNLGFYDGSWHDTGYSLSTSDYLHIVIVINGTDFKLYANGVLQKDLTINTVTQSSNLVFGSRYSEDATFFNGYMDNIRISNISLSSTQIALLYKMENKTLFTFGNEINLLRNILWLGTNF